MQACVVIPAFNAARSLKEVVRGLREMIPELPPEAFIVVDDGSTDATAAIAKSAGVTIVSIPVNGGKGAALRAGLRHAHEHGFAVAVTVDADGQHPPASARIVLDASTDPAALVLGIRDLQGAGAPKANQTSNRISNLFLSLFAFRALADTQCGLRRYPVARTRALGGKSNGYAYEAEIILRASAARVPLVEVPIAVYYPPEHERITHFHKVRDPARIVAIVVRTLFDLWLWRKKLRVALLAIVLGLYLTHVILGFATAISAPAVALPSNSSAATGTPTLDAGIWRLGPAYTRLRSGINEVYLEGSPEEIGTQHARLLRPKMILNEGVVWDDFETHVPVAPARALLMDLGRYRYRHVDRGIPPARLREVAAEALAFAPDPFAKKLPTFHRMVFLHALYDIALSFEHSPLIGCSVLALGPNATADGHTLVARAFDFEAGEVFDREKAVFFVRGNGGEIPFASVAWPGLVGVMTGMNAEGVYVSVNGARAGEPRTEGIPVVFSLREVLEQAHTTDEAVAVLRRQTVMVSHLVFVADARGSLAVVERAPGVDAFVRDRWDDPSRVALTNHYEGPLAADARDRAVRAGTSTLARRARADELVRGVADKSATVASTVELLRDHKCAGGARCELGDRRAIDALIATHGVVADTTDRTLWVSGFPHLSGAFVRFDLREIFAPGHDPARDPDAQTLPPDPILKDGRYDATRRTPATKDGP